MVATHLGQIAGAPAGWLRAKPPDPAGIDVASHFSNHSDARLDADQGLAGEVATVIRRWAGDGAADGPERVAEQARAAFAATGGLLRAASPDRLIPSAVTPNEATRLEDYLHTRCIELIVHTDDLAVSVGLPAPTPDPVAARIAIEALVTMGQDRAGALAVLRSLTRPDRSGSPPRPLAQAWATPSEQPDQTGQRLR